MGIVLLENEAASTTGASLKSFVESLMTSVTSTITLSDIAIVVGSIILAGITFIVAWKFGRKGYNFIKSSIMGKGGKI